MVRAIAITYFILLPQTAEASICHKYSRWYYPWPQRCETRMAIREMPIVLPPRKDPEIPLPEVINEDWDSGNAVDEMKARLLLRGMMTK